MAVVCLVHGLGEHSDRYTHLAHFLNQEGIVLLAFDLPGHGKSPGLRGYSPGLESLLDDISFLLDISQTRFRGIPCFLYGHSLGANLAVIHALKRPSNLSGLILTGPGFKLNFEPPAWKLFIARVLGNIMPSLTMQNELERPALSRDSEVVKAYVNDPLVHDRVSTRLAMDGINSGEWALENADKLTLPILLAHGGADRLTSVDASKRFAAKVGPACQLVVFDDWYHEVHNEPEKEVYFQILLKFIKEQVA